LHFIPLPFMKGRLPPGSLPVQRRHAPSMKKYIASFCVLAAAAALSCGHTQWTPEERNAFQTKCSKTETIHSLRVSFRGYEDNAFDAVVVKEYKDSKLLGSFKVPVPPAQSQWDREHRSRSATIDRTINISHSYEFIVPGQRPFRLADMKMIMWAQYTMNSEGWGCVMGDYTIDGKRFEHDASPTFDKR
jgi:hypothetical protein